MLVLSREKEESLMVGDDVEITIVDVRGDKIRLGIRAPRSLPIHRREVWDRIQKDGIDRKNPYTVDATHTDPVQQETALCLKYRQRAKEAEAATALAVKQLARAEKALAVIAGCSSCVGCQSEAKKAIADKQLEDVPMPDEGGCAACGLADDKCDCNNSFN